MYVMYRDKLFERMTRGILSYSPFFINARVLNKMKNAR